MFTSDTNKSSYIKKTALAYLWVSIACVLIANIYSLFGHGIRSDYMDYMFLYPFASSALFILVCETFQGNKVRRLFRLGFNLYNSGIAALTAGSLLNGVMEVAGTDAKQIKLFYVFGWILAISGAISLILDVKRVKIG